jgi:hypothetical protein
MVCATILTLLEGELFYSLMVCVCVCLCVCVHTFLCVCVCVCVYIYVFVYMFMCACVVYIFVWASVFVCVCVCVYASDGILSLLISTATEPTFPNVTGGPDHVSDACFDLWGPLLSAACCLLSAVCCLML